MEDPNVPLASTPGSGPPLLDSTALRRPPFFHSVFVGPEGLRAAWRILFYLAMAWMVDYVLSFALAPMLSPDLHGKALLLSRLVDYLVQVTAIILPAFVMARIEKREFDVYGLPRHSAFGKFFWVGAIWGIVSITLLLLMMRGAGAFYFGGFALHGIRVLKFAAYWGAFFLLVGCAEEFLFRGYTLYTVTTGMGFWPAAILMSLLFGGVHLRNPGENYVGGLGAALMGFFFCLTLRRTGHLWFAIGFHASWDWGQSFLYSVPDSGGMVTGHLMKSSFQGPAWLTGGSVGPEGSVLVFGIIALLWILFDRVYPQARYPTVSLKEVPTSSS